MAGVVQGHDPAPALALLPPAEREQRGRATARRYLRRVLRESGLLYGTPASAAPGPTATAEGSRRAPEETLFLAVVRTLGTAGCDIATLSGHPEGRDPRALLVLFAALTGKLDEAESLHAALLAGKPPPKRAERVVEEAMEERAMSLASDPVYGLALHNGAVYVDAQVFGRQAIDYFVRGELRRRAAERRLNFAAREKALLVETLTALATSERRPSLPARRAILRQVEDLKLPPEIEDALRDRVKKAFARKSAYKESLKSARSLDARRFILEQVLLASLVDGTHSAKERAFLDELAASFGFGPDQVRRTELEVAEFYAKNRAVVDVFQVSTAAETMGEELVGTMGEALEKNLHRLWTEIRETGELSVLLAKAARGQKLSAEEKKAMRAQLIDVAKAIPALAIFAAPGGVLLLIALAKVLPFDLLPSAFHDEDEP